MRFVVSGIPENISSTVRTQMVSPQYRSLHAFSALANGYGPCRSCLRTFDEGNEDRTSFTYDPVDGVLDLPLECERYQLSAFPAGLREVPIYFEAFDGRGLMRKRTRAIANSEDEQITTMLAERGVDFRHIRNAEAGCFIARIERAG